MACPLLSVLGVSWRVFVAAPAVTLGRVGGVPVRAELGSAVVVALVASSLGWSYFPLTAPELATIPKWTGAVAGTLLLFGSLLAHELAHAMVARAHGVDVRGVTLHLLGGVSEMTREPSTAASEARIAAAGPVVSFAIAAACAAVLGAFSSPVWVAALLCYVGAGNLLLGAFNLLPALPLDGGRLLHAVLWAREGHAERATWLVALVSRGLAAVVITLGGLAFLGGQLLAGVWLAVLGAFVLDAARSAGRPSAHAGVPALDESPRRIDRAA